MHIALIRRQRRPVKRSGGLQLLRFALVALATFSFSIVGVILLVAGLGFGVYAVYAKDISQDLADREIDAETIGIQIDKDFKTTRIYDRTGQVLLYEIIPDNGGRRVQVPLSSIPEYLRNATIAMEDKTFYTNPAGINIEGVARAIWGELRGVNAGGGSSISQQLIRNVIMTPEERFERSYVRKVKEVILSYQLTQKYPGVEGRDKILEWYLNTIFYGHFAYGVEAAAQTYFNKPVQDLTLAEAAMLVPCGQSPALNPIDAPEEAKKRQEIVLDEMYLQGYITAEEAWEAKQETLVIAPPRFDMVAPHYVLYVRDMLEKRFGTEAVYGGGLQVITAIDLEVQAKAEEIARARIAEMREPHNAHNAAITVLDTKTGELLAMVGSLDYHDESIDGQVNMALSPLQPGSSFKPFTYATALAQGFTPATMIMDVRTSFPDPPNPVPYVPENFSRNYHGPLLLRQALACSYNIPAVAVAHKVGIDNVVRTARAMGITTLDASSYGLSLTLGGYPVTVLDMAYGFSVFANGGTMVGQTRPASLIEPGERRLDPVAILQVTDANGNPLDYGQREVQPVIRPEVAFLITDILSDNQARTQAFGANSKLVLKDRPAAVKTGTTNDFYDGWTVGYTPQYTVGVWVGNTNHEKMKNADGSRVAAPIWNDLMVWLHDGLPVEGFARPAGIETAIVDSVSGKLPTAYSGGRIQEVFMKDGGMPTETDDVHFPFRICNATGKLATVHCPADQVETKVFSIFPPEADNWVREQGIPQPPNDYCDVHGPNLANTDVSITSPKAMSGVNGIVSIMGNARAGGQEKYWLEYGPGMNPGVWYPIGPEHGHQVENDLLETWDTRSLTGLYTLRLSVVDGGNLRRTEIPVVVDNSAPSLYILSPTEGQVFERGKDEWINIQVEAEDNVSMQRVEFYMDGRLLGYSTVAPYTMMWMLKSSVAPEYDMNLPEPVEQETPEGIVRMEVTMEGDQRVFTRTVQKDGAVTTTRVVESPGGGISWTVTGPDGAILASSAAAGKHTIHVVAVDAAGNRVTSEPVRVEITYAKQDK